MATLQRLYYLAQVTLDYNEAETDLDVPIMLDGWIVEESIFLISTTALNGEVAVSWWVKYGTEGFSEKLGRIESPVGTVTNTDRWFVDQNYATDVATAMYFSDKTDIHGFFMETLQIDEYYTQKHITRKTVRAGQQLSLNFDVESIGTPNTGSFQMFVLLKQIVAPNTWRE